MSSGATTATHSIPRARHVRNTRRAISPRFATSRLLIATRALYVGALCSHTLDCAIRLFGRTAVVLAGNAVGLIAASLALDDFRIDVTAVALLTPFLESVMRRNRSAATVGGAALISTFAALLVTDLPSDSLGISGGGTWVAATVIVWVGSLIAGFVLP